VDALRWANETEAEADRHGLTDNKKVLEGLRTSDLLQRFRDTVVPNRRGRAVETIVINAFLRQPLAKIRLSDLTCESFATYRDDRLKVVRPGTVIRELGLIQHIFEVARTDWSIPLSFNPVKAIRKPKADRPRERRISPAEWERLLQAVGASRNPMFWPLIRFAVETGMRRGELLNARWNEINWSANTLLIPITKNGEPRTIPLSTGVREILTELRGEGDRSSNELIFGLSAVAVALGWKRLIKRAGITDLHFHDLRHEAISRFFERGLSIPEVALISGHKDPRMLFRYTHLRAEDIAKKLNRDAGTLAEDLVSPRFQAC
jgi:integrase